jgi:DNA-binding PucR family transcriptional regulator
VALIASGPGADEAIAERARASGLPSLLVTREAEKAWGWLGSRTRFGAEELDALIEAAPVGGTRLAIGEPGGGLTGWRLSHHQARAALSVAERSTGAAVRYGDVAMLASVLKDELLGTSLRRIYLEPLEDGRNGGEELRQTLRAYFAANRNVSVAGSAIGVTRQAVARRLRVAEERLGRSISACGTELELALRLDALEATPPFAP